MTLQDITIVDVPFDQRSSLDRILDESFEGWYLRHSKGTIRNVELVRAAIVLEKAVGLIMLKKLGKAMGYVYYVAVAKAERKKGIAKILLDNALQFFRDSGATEVFASVEEDNMPSEILFGSRGFTRTSYGEVSRKYGRLRTLNMYREMTVVPGEVLLHKAID